MFNIPCLCKDGNNKAISWNEVKSVGNFLGKKFSQARRILEHPLREYAVMGGAVYVCLCVCCMFIF